MRLLTNQKTKLELSKDYTVFDLIMDQRKADLRQAKTRMRIHTTVEFIKTLSLVGFAIWCYLSHCTIIAYLQTFVAHMR